jgi:dTDP-glucose 4,6-dehydratase
VRTFEFPPGEFSHVIHAASEESTKLNAANPLLMVDTLVEGTRQALEFARFSGAKAFLLTSSGAVYGRQPAELLHIPEEYAGGPDPLSARAAYAEGKRAAELLCAVYARQHGIEPKIARGFAFIGPYLPLDGHFAAGNFVRDGIRGGPINVQSDGTPYRTYLYAADLAIWLWTILFRGAPGRAYNVGSEEAISIAGLAAAVAAAFDPPPPVRIAGTPTPGKPVERYVPSVQRAQSELQLRAWVSLPEAIRRTVRWAST